MFILFCIADICKLLCTCIKGVLLNEDLMMMMMMNPRVRRMCVMRSAFYALAVLGYHIVHAA